MEGRLRLRLFADGASAKGRRLQGQGRNAWKKCWFVIDRGVFVFSRKFRDFAGSTCFAIHNLTCDAVPENVAGRKHVFSLNFGSAVCWCQATSSAEALRWRKVFVVKSEFLALRRSLNWNDDCDLRAAAPRIAHMLSVAVEAGARPIVAEIMGTVNHLCAITPSFVRAFVQSSGLTVLARSLGGTGAGSDLPPPKEVVRAIACVADMPSLHNALISAGVVEAIERFSRHGSLEGLSRPLVRLLLASDVDSVRRTMGALKSSAAVQLIPLLLDAGTSHALVIDAHLRPGVEDGSLDDDPHTPGGADGRVIVSESRASVSPPEPLRPRVLPHTPHGPHPGGPASNFLSAGSPSTPSSPARRVPRLLALTASVVADNTTLADIIALRPLARSLQMPLVNDYASLILVFTAIERLAEEPKFRTKLTRPLRSPPFLRSSALRSRPIARLFARVILLMASDSRHEVHRVAWAKGRREGALPCLEPLLLSDNPADRQLCVQLVSVLSSHHCCGHRIARDSQSTALDALVRLARMGDADCLKTLCDMVRREVAPALVRAHVPSSLRALFLDANVNPKLRYLASEALDGVRELRLEQWHPSNVIVSELACFTAARSLSLKGSYIGDGVVSSLAAFLPSLTTINFAMTSITDAEFALLVPNARCLRTLVVPTQCGDAAVTALLPLANTLEELDLAICRITPACFASLAKMTALRDLNLFSTATNDECVRHLSKGLVNLRRLNLCMTRVTDEGAATLSNLVRLTHLNLKNTVLHTSTAVALRAALVDLVEFNIDFTNADPRMFAS